ncbi:MAG: heat shock protein DnaJ protein [Candidatus Saccharibacteria bacterium]|nr:heat shock protein DnaJ protein [Candidatus Saccharibacteria bacterium]
MNHRETLGVSPNASSDEIRRAFREAAKEVHPDHSNSPEAAEAFNRIKEAHNALLKDADEKPRESVTEQSAAARATAATATVAFAKPTDDENDDVTEFIQKLDEAVRASAKKSFIAKRKESAEVRKHRKKLKTNERRLRGLY